MQNIYLIYHKDIFVKISFLYQMKTHLWPDLAVKMVIKGKPIFKLECLHEITINGINVLHIHPHGMIFRGVQVNKSKLLYHP